MYIIVFALVKEYRDW